jgi:hypothetical protein
MSKKINPLIVIRHSTTKPLQSSIDPNVFIMTLFQLQDSKANESLFMIRRWNQDKSGEWKFLAKEDTYYVENKEEMRLEPAKDETRLTEIRKCVSEYWGRVTTEEIAGLIQNAFYQPVAKDDGKEADGKEHGIATDDSSKIVAEQE